MTRSLSLVAATCIALATTVGSAAAVVVNFNGVDYEVSTKTGLWPDLNDASITDGTRLQDQVWWGDSAAAEFFADAVRCSLGCDFGGPVFGYEFTDLGESLDRVAGWSWLDFDAQTGGVVISGIVSDTFAVAEALPAPIPLPAGVSLLLTGVAGIALFRRRKKT